MTLLARSGLRGAILAAVASVALVGAAAAPASAHGHGRHGHHRHHRRHHAKHRVRHDRRHRHHRHHGKGHPTPKPGHPGGRPPVSVLFVSPTGSDASPSCAQSAPCRTIGHAVSLAGSGATVVVLPGTYAEQVTIAGRLNLVGKHGATIDATGQTNGVAIEGPSAAGSTVTGFVVEHATQEGIVATRTAHLKIADNVVQNNDLGATSSNPTGECAPQGEVPGDCGEGIHLMSVTDVKVLGNEVTQNAGGILLTDELGPTTRNLIAGNDVFENPLDCGITVAGHDPMAVQNGARMPNVAGIFDNWIVGNRSDDNGLRGEGAGILLAGAGPGTGVYDNVVKRNEASGNNLAGITLHSHAPGDDLNGNAFVKNKLRNDNVGGDPDAGVRDTTGILLFSAVTRLQGTVVRGNVIRDVHFGIWTQNVPPIDPNANVFVNVDVPLQQQ
ncbi:MAG TPA: NosD domain-containing protein [Conexibacter sp.]|nr:NosD domain-containing protein [Conexibacter sp.]